MLTNKFPLKKKNTPLLFHLLRHGGMDGTVYERYCFSSGRFFIWRNNADSFVNRQRGLSQKDHGNGLGIHKFHRCPVISAPSLKVLEGWNHPKAIRTPPIGCCFSFSYFPILPCLPQPGFSLKRGNRQYLNPGLCRRVIAEQETGFLLSYR